MGICTGCRETFNKKMLKDDYCKNCYESLNLQDNSTISFINITNQKKKEEKKHRMKIIGTLILISLGIIGASAYALA